MTIRMRPLCAALLLVLSGASTASGQADTVRRRPFFTWRDAAILEAFVIGAVAVAPLDRKWAERLQNPAVQENRRMRSTARIVETVTDPGAHIIGVSMYAVGRLTKNERLADLGLHGMEALVVGAQLGSVLKGVVGRARPYVNTDNPHDYRLFRGFGGGSADFRSMPSGHTIAAFAAASAVTSETKRWWPKSVWIIGPIMYGGAATVGWSRMYDNKHWASDVISGAAIGTFTGLKIVHWNHYSHPGNVVDRILLGASVEPLPDGQVLVRLHVSPDVLTRLGLGG